MELIPIWIDRWPQCGNGVSFLPLSGELFVRYEMARFPEVTAFGSFTWGDDFFEIDDAPSEAGVIGSLFFGRKVFYQRLGANRSLKASIDGVQQAAGGTAILVVTGMAEDVLSRPKSYKWRRYVARFRVNDRTGIFQYLNN